MSDAGSLITAILADAATAIPGIVQIVVPVNPEEIQTEDLPAIEVLHTGYEVELLPWMQEGRTWIVSGVVYQTAKDETRETMELKLEAFRDELMTDPTLDGNVDLAVMVFVVPDSDTDSRVISGSWTIQARRVV